MAPIFNFRPKGFIQRGYIEGIPGWFETLRFRYRVISNKQRALNYEKVTKLTLNGQEEFYQKELASRLVEWDLKDQDGNPVPINWQIFDQLQNELASRLTKIANGNMASDIDPEWALEEQEQYNEILDEAKTDELSPGEATENNLVKN